MVCGNLKREMRTLSSSTQPHRHTGRKGQHGETLAEEGPVSSDVEERHPGVSQAFRDPELCPPASVPSSDLRRAGTAIQRSSGFRSSLPQDSPLAQISKSSFFMKIVPVCVHVRAHIHVCACVCVWVHGCMCVWCREGQTEGQRLRIQTRPSPEGTL